MEVKKYEMFKNNNYKHCYLIADSTDLHWDYKKIIDKIDENPLTLFGSGLLMTGLTNNFSNDESNLFLNEACDIYIKQNIWD